MTNCVDPSLISLLASIPQQRPRLDMVMAFHTVAAAMTIIVNCYPSLAVFLILVKWFNLPPHSIVVSAVW
jgi:hypothetical protein